MIGRRETYSAVRQNTAISKPTAIASRASGALAPRANGTGAYNNTRRVAASSKGNMPMPKTAEGEEAVKYIVKYITKQIYICPTQPILTVGRLPHLEYHVNELTKSIGRRPCLYLQGKSVQLVPESSEEHETIQRYLTQLETEEGIVWCSRSLPPGSGLKVNVMERVVKVIKIAEDFE